MKDYGLLIWAVIGAIGAACGPRGSPLSRGTQQAGDQAARLPLRTSSATPSPNQQRIQEIDQEVQRIQSDLDATSPDQQADQQFQIDVQKNRIAQMEATIKSREGSTATLIASQELQQRQDTAILEQNLNGVLQRIRVQEQRVREAEQELAGISAPDDSDIIRGAQGRLNQEKGALQDLWSDYQSTLQSRAAQAAQQARSREDQIAQAQAEEHDLQLQLEQARSELGELQAQQAQAKQTAQAKRDRIAELQREKQALLDHPEKKS